MHILFQRAPNGGTSGNRRRWAKRLSAIVFASQVARKAEEAAAEKAATQSYRRNADAYFEQIRRQREQERHQREQEEKRRNLIAKLAIRGISEEEAGSWRLCDKCGSPAIKMNSYCSNCNEYLGRVYS